MIASDDLHRLISSLNKAEKRYFQLYASRYESKKENNYQRLFRAIEKQEEYNEEAIKQQFKAETFVRHLPSEKNYLYNLILDSLHHFYGEYLDEQRLRKRIHYASILLDRGLTDQSLKILRKAKKLAAENEHYAIALEILYMEKLIAARTYYAGNSADELELLYQQEKEYLQKITEANEYWRLFSRFYHFHYRKGSSRDTAGLKTLQEIMSHPLLTDITHAHSFQTRLDFFHIHALYHFMQGSHADAASYNKSYLSLLESRPDKIKAFSKRYMATLNNYLMDCLGLQQYKEVEEGIRKLRALPANYTFYNTPNIQADIFRLSVILELNLYIKTGEFQSGLRQVDYILSGLKTYESQIVRHNILTIQYLLAYLYFGVGKFPEALRWLNRIINEAEEQVLQDIQAFTRIFSLIVHYELNNYDILEYLQASAYRYVSKKSTFYKAETILFRYLKRLSGAIHKKELSDLFQKLRTEMLPLSEDPKESKAFEYFDIMSWLDAKISGRSLAEEIRNATKTAESPMPRKG